MGVVVAKGLEDSRGLQVELCFGDAFVYQTCPRQSSYGQENMEIAQNMLTIRGPIDGF
jgi:hypothetical protein